MQRARQPVWQISSSPTTVSAPWILANALDAIKIGLAPIGFTVNHARRPVVAGSPLRGGGLTFVAAGDILVRVDSTDWIRTSTGEHRDRPPGGSGGEHMPTTDRIQPHPNQLTRKSSPICWRRYAFQLATDCLLLCGDFNLPGKKVRTFDDNFRAPLDRHNMKKFVDQTTRRSASNTRGRTSSTWSSLGRLQP